MISVADARASIDREIDRVGVTAVERIAFQDAVGRTLAEDVIVPFSLPRFTNSAMDGFAVRAADIADAKDVTPARLRVVERIRAGDAPALSVERGTAIQIMTGAPMPNGADAVVPVEATGGYPDDDDRDPVVEIRTTLSPRANVRFAGEEVEAGSTVVARGARIGPAELGVIASVGLADVEVYARPCVAIYATGDELREPGTPLGEGEIYNSNLYVLAALARFAGAEVTAQRVIADDPAKLRTFLAGALEQNEFVVSSGGVSMGKHDYVRDAMQELGVEDRFWQVAQKPAKPLAFATRGDTLVFGLPGNPISSFVAFLEYVRDAIVRRSGGTPSPTESVRLAAPFARDPKKHRFLFGRFVAADSVRPVDRLGSHMLTAGIGADALIGVPPGDGDLSIGAVVEARRLPWSTGGAA